MFRYEGQISVETVQVIGTPHIIENGPGARGIDRPSETTGSGTSILVPLCDAHGNQVATVAGSGCPYGDLDGS
ncbi:MAG: hypothetical protein ACYC96_15925 [Fimbriimonadaceae bacterium]